MRDKIRKKVRNRKGSLKHVPTEELKLIAFMNQLAEQTRQEKRSRKTRMD